VHGSFLYFFDRHFAGLIRVDDPLGRAPFQEHREIGKQDFCGSLPLPLLQEITNVHGANLCNIEVAKRFIDGAVPTKLVPDVSRAS
jgi:hypothetical protein